MCTEFQHLRCQVIAIKSLAYLLTYFIAVVIAAVAWNQLSLLLTLAFTGKIYFRIIGLGLGLGLGLGTSGLVNIPDNDPQ